MEQPSTIDANGKTGAIDAAKQVDIRDRIKELRRVPAKELLPNPKNWRRDSRDIGDSFPRSARFWLVRSTRIRATTTRSQQRDHAGERRPGEILHRCYDDDHALRRNPLPRTGAAAQSPARRAFMFAKLYGPWQAYGPEPGATVVVPLPPIWQQSDALVLVHPLVWIVNSSWHAQYG